MSQMVIFNCGSSSIKFAYFRLPKALPEIEGLVESIGTSQAQLSYRALERSEQQALGSIDFAAAIELVATCLLDLGVKIETLVGVGHRVVHGGSVFSAPVVIDDQVLSELKTLSPLAPLHNPINCEGIVVAQRYFKVPHVAVFDTAFHQTMPERAFLYGLPYKWYQQHQIRRYGFHGVSHHYVSQKALELLKLDPDNHGIITAHLGNGASITAIQNSQSMDTSMGFTPLEGVIMGTRSGSVDPGLLPYLMQVLGQDVQQLIDDFNRRSGLLGISGLSHDMRQLEEAAASGHRQAQLAIELFCYRIAQMIAAQVMALSRWDVLVFTGGIGQHAAQVRAKVVQHLHHFKVHLAADVNAQHGAALGQIHSKNSAVKVMIVETAEEFMIAKQASALLKDVP